ncbi:MAG: ATP-binding protein [Burkholderiaceae bacterium]
MRRFPIRAGRTILPAIAVFIALVTVTLIAVEFFISIERAQAHRAQTSQIRRTISELDHVVWLLRDAQAGVRGFVIAGDPAFLDAYSDALAQLENTTLSLRNTIASEAQLSELVQLRTLIDETRRYLEHAVRLRRDNADPAAAAAYISAGNGERAIGRVRTQVGLMQDRERNWLTTHESGARLSASHMKTLVLIGTVAVYLMIGAAFWLLNREIRQRWRADQALGQANAKLQRRANQLKASNQELESFSYSISHDLRIPLRAVIGYARMLEEDYGERLDAEGHRLLQVIRDNGQRMGQLIDDLLAFSRLGRAELTASQIDMHDLVEPLVAEVQQRDKHAAVEFDIQPLAPAWGDAALLQQVWINLVSNAVKYSGKRAQPKIRISSAAGADENVYSVADNGAGFDMRYVDKLFGVFQRLHSADDYPGTGVGLAIVQRIVARHGGRVWAEAEPDRGATFHFALPNKEIPHG